MPERIVYLSWPAREITGGIEMAFRHVEILREAGFNATIATEDAQSPGWFDTTASIVGLEAVTSRDAIVFPENHRGLLERFGIGDCHAAERGSRQRRAVFCQNPYMVRRGLGKHDDYASYGVSTVLTDSPRTAEFCRQRFPSLDVEYMPTYVNRDLFHLQPQKAVQIAFAPRKRGTEADFIIDVFRAMHPAYRSVPWVLIERMPQRQVAEVLRQSAVYLALCRFESAPHSLLEAFACGCVVAGFAGIGGRLFANDCNGFWAAEDDCLGCVAQLASAVRLVKDRGPSHADMLEAAAHTASLYSRERLAHRLVGFWKRFLEGDNGGRQDRKWIT